jgi:hypothetical protein
MDTFIANFINALPNALATAVVTVILSGVILFLFQERIKTSLAKSLYEHQTKFSRNYEKQVETLETLYKKYLLFDEAFTDMVWTATDYRVTSVDKEIKIDFDAFNIVTEINLTLDEFREYFMNNRLFLSAYSIAEVEKILWGISIMPTLIFSISLANEPDDVESLNRIIKSHSHISPIKLSPLDAEKPNYPMLLSEMVQAVKRCSLTLERLYKSGADTE